ncbi:hypothetical protein FALCPG4_004440 [Fusarium falciforme]
MGSSTQLGYAAELPKTLSMMSILGMSFAIMAVPFGLSTTFYITLVNGQAVTIIWGWVLVSLISLSIAASLAEICAVYPTAGGVYYWSAILSTPKYAPAVSFIDGWMTLVGNWTVTLSINFSGAQLILSAITIFNEDFVPNEWQTVLCFWAVMLVAALINAFGSKYLDLFNKLCIYWTGASVVIILVTLLVMADTRRSADFVFGHFDASASGWPGGWSFFVGLLQAAYTLTGYGMVAAMCEEVQNPEREVPKAMVLSVVAAGLTGVVYLVPVLFVLPDVTALLASSQPIGLLFKTVTGSAAGGFGLLFLILGIWLFAGVGALTAASRCTYAFAPRWWNPWKPVGQGQQDSRRPSMGHHPFHNRRLSPGMHLLRLVCSFWLLHRCRNHLPLGFILCAYPGQRGSRTTSRAIFPIPPLASWATS